MKYRLIGLYELFTGVLGVLLVFLNVSKVIEDRNELFSFVTGLLLYTGLAIAGYALMNNGKKVAKYSLIIQALQLISITYNGSQYLFSASAFLSIYYSKGIHFHSQILPVNYNIAEVSTLLPFEIRIFLVPILFLAILLIGNEKQTK